MVTISSHDTQAGVENPVPLPLEEMAFCPSQPEGRVVSFEGLFSQCDEAAGGVPCGPAVLVNFLHFITESGRKLLESNT